MNLLWLEDFLALASTGNFSRAAEERHMTQPAFSRRIRALEEWLGVVLIDRTTHPAALTEAGEWFRSVAQEILARVAQIPDEARAIADATSATLRIASTHALVVHVPAVVAAQPRVANRHRADPARERRAAALRGADGCRGASNSCCAIRTIRCRCTSIPCITGPRWSARTC